MGRRRVRLVVLAFFLLSAPVLCETLSELFQTAKTQVKNRSWQEALKTLDRLAALSANPGNETARRQLLAPIAFYRGVCEANLGQAEQAAADFATYRHAQPDSAIDETMYSKKAVAAFNAAGHDASTRATVSLLRRFEEFKGPANVGEKPDARWADGPVKWLLTPEETAAWAALTGEAERAEFAQTFWERRNPNPGSSENAARTDFDRRVAFADAYFRLDEQQRGSLTDPGMVFVLLGPPVRTGRKPILGTEENNISDGSSVPGYWYMAGHNSVHFDGFTVTDAASGFREIWYYRREALPKAVSANELSVLFVTKVGLGRFVLDRDAAVLAALAEARSGASESRVAVGARPQ